MIMTARQFYFDRETLKTLKAQLISEDIKHVFLLTRKNSNRLRINLNLKISCS